jgi:ABC-2 type transport system ATP-binding protein
MSALAIDVRGLTKSYGETQAVRGIDLQVSRGEVFSLLGPNGAGKTTTVEILEGHRSRTSGSVSVLGHDPGRSETSFKARIGIVLQETGVERFLTVSEVVDRFRDYYPNPRPRDEVIELVGLQDKRNERVRKLSGGQQRRLDVAIGLAGDPELLFLDEPTTGFDPSARRNAWQMIANLKELGKTVFLTTHYMDEAQHLADRVAIIVDGRIVAEGPPSRLTADMSSATTVTFNLPDGASPPPELSARPDGTGRWRLETAEPTSALHLLTSWALGTGIEIAELSVTRASLEDVYLKLSAEAGERV